MLKEHTHIVKSFDKDLQKLSEMLFTLSKDVITQLTLASKAVVEHDLELAQKVFENDDHIDLQEHNIVDFSLQLLAQRQPFGADLRLIVSAFKISTNLERIGDYAENMVKRILKNDTNRKLSESNPFRRSFLHLTEIIIIRLEEIMKAFLEHDKEKAYEFWQKDQEINEFYNRYFQEILNYMVTHPNDIPYYTNLLFMFKNLERAGDRIINIAEAIVFIRTGSSRLRS